MDVAVRDVHAKTTAEGPKVRLALCNTKIKRRAKRGA